MKNVLFFIRHFTERGTEVSAYDYARFNEEVLNNKSYIVHFSDEMARYNEFGFYERISYDKFHSRFPIFEIHSIYDLSDIIDEYNIDFFYTQTHGGKEDVYHFGDKNIWNNCKTIKHCVFNTKEPQGDFSISISEFLSKRDGTTMKAIPLIVHLPDCNEDMRDELNIPKDAIVIGRHGCDNDFNIPMAQEAVKEILAIDETIYFLFLNTIVFYEHPRILYLPRNVDLIYKTKFINTCDAMLHARIVGETFGLAVGEFSIRNKPVITCNCGDLAHIEILGDKGILYNTKDELMDILKNIRKIISSKDDWNAYRDYSPEKVMQLFDRMIFSKAYA